MKTKWLKIKAGKVAYEKLLQNGLRKEDIRIMPGAAGGPKWLIQYALDKYFVDEFLPGHTRNIHFIGGSIGAWRSASYTCPDPSEAFDRLLAEFPESLEARSLLEAQRDANRGS